MVPDISAELEAQVVASFQLTQADRKAIQELMLRWVDKANKRSSTIDLEASINTLKAAIPDLVNTLEARFEAGWLRLSCSKPDAERVLNQLAFGSLWMEPWHSMMLEIEAIVVV